MPTCRSCFKAEVLAAACRTAVRFWRNLRRYALEVVKVAQGCTEGQAQGGVIAMSKRLWVQVSTPHGQSVKELGVLQTRQLLSPRRRHQNQQVHSTR